MRKWNDSCSYLTKALEFTVSTLHACQLVDLRDLGDAERFPHFTDKGPEAPSTPRFHILGEAEPVHNGQLQGPSLPTLMPPKALSKP